MKGESSEQLYYLKREVFEVPKFTPKGSVLIHEAGYELWEISHRAMLELTRKGVTDPSRSMSAKYVEGVTLPCRANLHKVLTLLFLDGDFKDEPTVKLVTEEECRLIKIIMRNRQEYSLWRKVREVLEKEGKERALELLRAKVPVLALREKLR